MVALPQVKPATPMLRLGGVAVDLAAVSAITIACNGRMVALGLAQDAMNCVPADRVARLLERLAGEIRRNFG